MFWYTASAVPMYQFALTRCIGGRISVNSPNFCATTLVQPSRICRFSDSALYCVRMYTRRRSELMQLERVISMMRYCPPNGTAGFARSRVSGKSRSPAPPAKSTPNVSFIGMTVPRGFWPANVQSSPIEHCGEGQIYHNLIAVRARGGSGIFLFALVAGDGILLRFLFSTHGDAQGLEEMKVLGSKCAFLLRRREVFGAG